MPRFTSLFGKEPRDRRWLPVAVLAWLCACSASPGARPPARAVDGAAPLQIEVSREGIQRLRFESIRTAWGLEASARIGSAPVGLRSGQRPLALWIEDGGDGRLDPGDWIEFAAAPGVLRLFLHDEAPRRMRDVSLAAGTCPAAAPRRLPEKRLRIERQLLRVPPSAPDSLPRPLWYWARLNSLSPLPLRLPLPSLGGFVPTPERPLRLLLQLRGESRLPPALASGQRAHALELGPSDGPHRRVEWDGEQQAHLEVELEPRTLALAEPSLELRMARREAEPGVPLVDVALLDWIELRGPVGGALGAEQTALWFESEASGCVDLALAGANPGSDALRIYGSDGARASLLLRAGQELRVAVAPFAPRAGTGGNRAVTEKRGGTSLRVAPPGSMLEPRILGRAGRGGWLLQPQRADAIVLAHASLLSGARRLAQQQRDRGLTVLVADVADVYDAFSGGQPTPDAIRGLVRHALEAWRGAPPRFLVLVGDADSVPAGSEGFGRGSPALIPTWDATSHGLRGASDHFFAADSAAPGEAQIAVGRIPAQTPEQLGGLLSKLEAAGKAGVGPWRRRLVWLDDGDPLRMQEREAMAATLAARGFAANGDRPQRMTAPAARRSPRAQALHRLASPSLLVHFNGHGAAYLWELARTGSPAQRLLRSADLAALPPGDRLPIVLAMTCDSAPFDVPQRESMGESWLWLERQGALAVIASSSPIAATGRLSQVFVEEILRGGPIGTALLRAKRRSGRSDVALAFNLLGDPTFEVSPPPAGIEIEWSQRAGSHERVRGTLPDGPRSGQVLVEWIDDRGRVLGSRQALLAEGRFDLRYRGKPTDLAVALAVRAYAWDQSTGADARGGLRVP